MPEIHCIIGPENLGKTTVLVKLYEMILRVYDNYEINVTKIPINCKGDFLSEIHIRLGQTQKKQIEKLEGCSSLKDNKKKQDYLVKILFQTAGDAVGNFDILNKKVSNDKQYLDQFDLIFFCLRVKKTDQCINDLKDIDPTELDAYGVNSTIIITELLKSAVLHNCIFGLNKNLDQLPINLISIVDKEVKKLY